MQYSNEKCHVIYDEAQPSGVDAAAAIRDQEIANYRFRLHRPGPMLEIEAYPVSPKKKYATAAKEEARSKAAQDAVNDRIARLKLDRLVQENFVEWQDYKIGVDYSDLHLPPTPEQAQAAIKKFIEKVRALYKAQGAEYKYIYVTPWLTKTGQPTKRLHHHIVMSAGVDRREIQKLWPYGRVHVDELQPDKNGLTGLSRYLHMHLHGTKHYVASRNVVMPQPSFPKARASKRRMADLALNYEMARDVFERQHKDYVFVSMEVRYSKVVPGAYIYVRMRHRDAFEKWQVFKHRKKRRRQHERT